MAILWCGGEDIDFPNSATPVVTTTAGNFRANYARCGLNTGSATAILKSTPFSAVTSVWFSMRMYLGNNSSVQKRMCGLGAAAAANKGIFVGFDNVTNGRFAIWKYDGTTETLLASESATSGISSTLNKFDVQITNFGSAGVINFWVNGALLASFSGTVTISGLTSFDTVIYGGNLASPTVFWGSEFIVADEDTRAMSLVTMAPNATGTTDTWTGTVPGNINPTTINDANSVFTNVITQDEQANLIDFPAGTFGVRAVKIAARAMSTAGATATKVGLGINQGGTIAPGTLQTTTTAFATYESFLTTNPVTSNPWLLSEMNGLQLNMRSG